jgi:RNA polymerase sigma factor for flagellar operon FliA
VEENLPLVYQVAWQVKRRVGDHVTVEELASAGVLGLIQALERFDGSRGLKLSTYVLHRIRGAMLDDLRRRDWMPRRVRSQSRRLVQAEQQLEQRSARPALPREVAGALAVDMPEYWAMKDDASTALLPLNAGPVAEGFDHPLEATLADDRTIEPDAVLLADERTQRIRDALGSLPERERIVLTLTYFEELSGSEIAGVLGITESRVSQIKRRALERLREVEGLEEAQR